MTDLQLSTSERSALRSALLSKGIRTRGLSNADMLAAYEEHCEDKAPQSPQSPQSPQEPGPAPIPQPEQKTPPEAPQTPTTEAIQKMTDTTDKAALVTQLLEMLGTGGGMDENRVIELIDHHATKTITVTAPDQRDPVKIETAHPALEDVIAWASTGTNIYMTGPAGSGKTTLAIQTAKALSLDFYSTGSVMASYELTGFRDAHGEYHASQLRLAFEHGGLFLFDEIDGSSAKALIAFNQLLANGSFTFPDGNVKKHPDFVAIAAGNTVGTGATRQYIGRNPLDGATLDRFVNIDIGYDERLEETLAMAEYEAHGGAEKGAVTHWVHIVRKARRQLADMGSTAIVSPRASIFGARGLARGLPTEKLIAQVITAELSEDQRAQLKLV